MDNNKQPLPQSPTPQPVQSAFEPNPSVIIPSGGSQVSTPSGGMNKVFLTIGAILLILIAAGVYLYMNNQKPAPKTESASTTTRPIVQEVDTTDSDLDAIDIQTEEAELNSIDSDIQAL